MDKKRNTSKKSGTNESQGKQRGIDNLVQDVQGSLMKTFVFIQKTKIKTWKGVFILAFAAGAAVAIIWTVSMDIQTSSKAAGEAATLSLYAADTSVGIGDTFNVDIMLEDNRDDYGVVAVKAIVSYNSSFIQPLYQSQPVDVDSYSFGGDVDDNACQYQGHPCQIIDYSDPDHLTITVSKPHPGVQNSDSIQVARITFKALNATNIPGYADTGAPLSLKYTEVGNYDDSDVILDDGQGTDILTKTVGTNITINAPACQFTPKNDWGNCQYILDDVIAGLYPGWYESQTYTKSPEGCSGEPNVSEIYRSCVRTCDSVTPGTWSVCIDNPNNSDPTIGYHVRNLTGTPEFCDITAEQQQLHPIVEQCDLPKCDYTCSDEWDTCGDDPNKDKDGNTKGGIQYKKCSIDDDSNTCYTPEDYHPDYQFCTVDKSATDCADVKYNEWSDCLPDPTSSDPAKIGKQIRTFTSTTPDGCVPTDDQVKDETKTCTAPACNYKYSDWGEYCYSDNTQKRTVSIIASSSFCQGTPDTLVRECEKSKDEDKDDKKSDEKKKSNDKTKPKLDIPLFLTKNKGDKIWWAGSDNKGIDHYSWSFAGRKGTTKATSINVPVKTGSGIHILTLRAWDKAGNMVRKYVAVRVR
jgi:hypothetical protein